ncbi:site-specific integrase [Mesorhizobium sp.]|uniref:tyrosine-type recombinase/integrase n=1 Tax=Mesorhizobium sp. TaxID=1871066 RepID=UPI0025F5035F|nr:site-specific integrase [Mesorhizobium sp.]
MSIRKRAWKTARGEARESWIVDYFDQDRKRAIKTFPSRKEAREWETTMRGEVREKRHVIASKSLTVAEAGAEWLKAVEHGRDDREPAEKATLRGYKHHLDAYIAPAMGTKKLTDLAKADVVTFRNELLTKLTRATAKKVLQSLKGILSEMVHQDRVGINVASAVKIGIGGRHAEEVEIPSIADIKAIRAKAKELPLVRRGMIETAIHTGMRVSEIRGLPWAAVDLKLGTIEVRQRADEYGVIGPPKSKAGKRTITLPDDLVSLLKELRLQAGKNELVFPTEAGTPWLLSNFYARVWTKLLTNAGVKAFGFHCLRHFHASMLIDSDANPKEIQTELGHSSIQMTYDLYGHLLKSKDGNARQKDRAEALAKRL